MPRPVGRPSKYSWVIGESIARRILEGRSLYGACSDFRVPVRTAKHWLEREPDFRHVVRLAATAAFLAVGRASGNGDVIGRVLGRGLFGRIVKAFYATHPVKRGEQLGAIKIPSGTDLLVRDFFDMSAPEMLALLRSARSQAEKS